MKVFTNIRSLMAAAAAACALSLCGCAATNGDDAEEQEEPGYSRKVLLDQRLDEKLKIADISTVTLESGLLMVQVTVENVDPTVHIFSKRQPVKFAFCFTWLDAGGKEVGADDEEAWIKK